MWIKKKEILNFEMSKVQCQCDKVLDNIMMVILNEGN